MDHTSGDENAPLIHEAAKHKKNTFCEILREEFRWRSFFFDFPNATAFYRSQWRGPRLIFVVFRLCLALYTGIICILTLVYFPRKNPHRPWIGWLTNWSYLLLTCHEIFSATVVLVHSTDRTTGCCCRELEDGEENHANYRRSKRKAKETEEADPPLPFYMKLSWLLYCAASNVAIQVTILILVTIPDIGRISVKDFNNHVMNGVVVVLELFVVALPVRFLHFVYVTIFYSLYFLWAYIFWSFDHTGNVLYMGMIDWNEPGDTMMSWLSMALTRPIAVQIFLYVVYRLRLFISTKIFGDED